MHLTQWCRCGENSASNIFTSNYQLPRPLSTQIFQSKAGLIKKSFGKKVTNSESGMYYEKPRKNSKGIRIPKEICKLDTVRT